MKTRVSALCLLILLSLVFDAHNWTLHGSGSDVQARQNLSIDPSGRVVDVAFSQDVALTAPWDRFRFDISIVQPLTRDGGAFLGDLTGDGVPDLIMASFSEETLFFPGIAGNPRRFGDGTYLQQTTSTADTDPFEFASAMWITGDVGDLDGDGIKEVVIGGWVPGAGGVGAVIYRNVGTPSQPKLQSQVFLTHGWDIAASLGDLNNDGKLDIVISKNYAGGLSVFWNNSTTGSFQFSEQLLHNWALGQAPSNRLSVGDLNGDGLLDLAGAAGIYFNTGTAQAPVFTFDSPSPWNVIGGGPSWIPTSDQGPNVFLKDTNGDGLLEAYVSNLSSTVWQALFYRNVGSKASHQFKYVGPVVASRSPINIFYRGESTPSISGSGAFVAAGDIDQNGLSDILLSNNGGTPFGDPTILWNFPNHTGSPLPPRLSYQDLYTFPSLAGVDRNCGLPAYQKPDALCKPPNLFSAWTDLTGDGLADALRTDSWMNVFLLYSQARTGSWPFAFGTDTAIQTAPSGTQATGYGAVLADVDLDGRKDVVTGTPDGLLLYYRNTAASGPATFADPVALADSTGTPIDVGEQSWPTSLDINGDGRLDLLVANYDGVIRKVLCVTPGTSGGYSAGALLGASEQDPVDVTHISGGGRIVPSLATVDVDGDGLDDVVMGDSSGRVWLLHNVGSSSAPSFSLGPLTVSRTAAANMERLDARHIRLYFALPIIPGQTLLGYHGVPASGSPLSGEAPIAAGGIRPAAGTDYDGDGKSDVSVWRPSTGVWYALPSNSPGSLTSTQWGGPTDTAVTGDYDGDGKSDVAVWRPSTGVWYVLPSGSPGTYTSARWGVSTDRPFPGDYDGDLKTDITVWRPSTGTWYVCPSGSPGTYVSTQWGLASDMPVPDDYDGDAKTDIAVWRPATGDWYLLLSGSQNAFVSVQWGLPGDIPVPGDYDGDGKADIAVWRPATGIWYIRSSDSPGTLMTAQWGISSDTPVPGDYDGDGENDLGAYRPEGGIWHVLPSNSPGTSVSRQCGLPTDLPLSSITRIASSIR